MRGLLHRLATRAAGTALAVRSDARLPYGADALGFGSVDPLEAPPAHHRPSDPPRRAAPEHVEANRREPQPAPAALPDPVPPRAPLTVDIERIEQRGARAPAPAAGPASPVHPAPAASRDSARPEPSSMATIEPVRSGEPSAFERGDRPPPAWLLPEPPAPDAPARVAPPPERAHAVASPSGPPASSEAPFASRQVRRADPVPLLPAEPLTAAGAVRGAAARFALPAEEPPGSRQGTSAASFEEPNEVHIHIGRIEVTAVHEAPARRPKPGTKTSPRSLDAYLASRSRT